LIFLLVAIFALAIIYGYIGLRLIPMIVRSASKRALLWGVTFILTYLPLCPGILRFNGIENRWVDFLSWIGYLDLGLFSLLCFFLIIKDLALGISMVAIKGVAWIRNFSGHETDQMNGERRAFLGNMINWSLVGLSGVLTGYGFYQAFKKSEVIRVEIPVKGLIKDLDGIRIVQLTDLHVGGTIKGDFVSMVVDQVNALRPDVIAMTGDLVDGSVDYLREDVAPLARLSAPLGSYFVTGNHEYYSNVHPWINEVKRLGFVVLVNQHHILARGKGRLLLAGVPDYRGGQFDSAHTSSPAKALQGADRHHYSILLAHQPRSIFAAERAGYNLQISGHTHGGQYFPGNFLASLIQPYTVGLHQHGNSMIYVSQGTGYWGPPMRVSTRSEITLFELKFVS
jgi:predicted MPP superfamily phosphohydrolase